MRPKPAHRTAASVPSSRLLRTLERRFAREIRDRAHLVVAFSGGPDSTALLWGLARIGSSLRLHAGHLDHGLDADSPRRAAAARALATRIGVPVTIERLRRRRPDAESPEAFARRHRYAFLHRLADRLDAPLIVTAHHADDQAETVLLRLLFGSGLLGLGAMSPTRGRLARPLLGFSHAELRQSLAGSGLEPVDDPTNSDLGVPRNAVRSRLLPSLEAAEPGTAAGLCRLAEAARRAGRRIERLIEPQLRLQTLPSIGLRTPGLAADRRALESLPGPVLPVALALLHRRAGAPYPASSAARRELLRQVRTGGAVGCDCGHGWRWEGDSTSFRLVADASSAPRFAYNLEVPGSVDVPEIALRVRLTRGRVAPWMFEGRAHRAGLADVDLERFSVTVRNRRPGDRMRPLGSGRQRRLKDLLIDRRIPRRERSRLPLLVIDDEIAWVPGVTIGDRFRLGEEATAWIAEIEDLPPPTDNPPSCREPAADDSSTER